MGQSVTSQLGSIAEKTDNDILLLIIVISLVVLFLAIPLYKAVSKSSKERRQQELAHEKLLLDVIKENTKVNAGLKTLLETSMGDCDNCKREQMTQFARLEVKVDFSNELLKRIVDKEAQHG